MIKFVSSNSFAAKSVEQMRVEQSQFEQFTPTRRDEKEVFWIWKERKRKKNSEKIKLNRKCQQVNLLFLCFCSTYFREFF